MIRNQAPTRANISATSHPVSIFERPFFDSFYLLYLLTVERDMVKKWFYDEFTRERFWNKIYNYFFLREWRSLEEQSPQAYSLVVLGSYITFLRSTYILFYTRRVTYYHMCIETNEYGFVFSYVK